MSSQTQRERNDAARRLSREAKAEERKWRNGLKIKAADDEWEFVGVGQACLIFRSKIYVKP